ncbi:hypothetical protein ACWD0G_07210 [Streptomyces goshikiensis]
MPAALDAEYANLLRSAASFYGKDALLPIDTIDAHLAAAIIKRAPAEAGTGLPDLAASNMLIHDVNHPIRGAVFRCSGPALAHAASADESLLPTRHSEPAPSGAAYGEEARHTWPLNSALRSLRLPQAPTRAAGPLASPAHVREQAVGCGSVNDAYPPHSRELHE